MSRTWTKVMQLQQKLQAWKQKWDVDHQSKVYEVVPISEVNSTRTAPWIMAFDFSNVDVANAFVMYHAIAILLTGIPLALLKAGPWPPLRAFTALDSLSSIESQSAAEIESSAVSICRCIDYYLQSSPKLRDFHLFFPAHVARRTLHHLGRLPELNWLADAFEVMLSRSTMGIWGDMDISDNFIGIHEGLFS